MITPHVRIETLVQGGDDWHTLLEFPHELQKYLGQFFHALPDHSASVKAAVINVSWRRGQTMYDEKAQAIALLTTALHSESAPVWQEAIAGLTTLSPQTLQHWYHTHRFVISQDKAAWLEDALH